MFCRNCGSRIPEGDRYCDNCGCPVQPEGMRRENRDAGPDHPTDRSEPKGKTKKQKKWLLIAIVAIIVIAGGCIGGIAMFHAKGDSAAYAGKLAQAVQYVDEGRNEEAEQAFLDLIAAEPKEEGAYLELADLYVAQERYQEAVAVLVDGEKNVSDKTQIKKRLKKTKKSFEGVWKTAYREVLEENMTGIRAYEANGETFEMAGNMPSTALCDLNEDGVPELLFFTANEAENPYSFNLRIFTHRNGEAVMSEYDWSFAVDEFQNGDQPRGFNAFFVDAGTYYAIFKAKGRKGFSIYTIFPGEGVRVTLSEYDMDSKGEIKENQRTGYLFNRVIGSEYMNKVDPSKAEYYSSGEESSREVFEERYDTACSKIGQSIFVFSEATSPYSNGYSDDGVIWEKAEEAGPVSKTYDEMIGELTVKEKKEKSGGDQYAEYEQYMTRLLDAYAAKDIETMDECNAKLPKNIEQMEVSEEERKAYESLYEEAIADGRIYDSGDYHFITDIDGDGKAEFLMSTGLSYAESVMEVWQYDGEKPVRIGETLGSCMVCKYPGRNGLVLIGAHTGTEHAHVVTLENGKLTVRDIGMREDSEPDFGHYLDLGCKLEWDFNSGPAF